jgi:hypothetical protein
LASVEGAAGNQRAAFELLGEAQAASMAGDEHWMSADIHRLAGETMLAGTAIRPAPSESSTLALARWHGSRARSCVGIACRDQPHPSIAQRRQGRRRAR